MLILEELLNDNGIIAECSLVKDRRRITVCRRGFGCAHLGISPMPPMQNIGAYDDSWDFPSPQAALKALETWKEDAPKGWHHHVATGRYRIDGDERLEYVKDDYRPDMSIEDHVIYAILTAHGQDRVVIEVSDLGIMGAGLFPQGTREFRVVSESSECDHDPKCSWTDLVYHYLDRSVVVRAEDLRRISVGDVIRRLTGKNNAI
jgi:hypothetical protein